MDRKALLFGIWIVILFLITATTVMGENSNNNNINVRVVKERAYLVVAFSGSTDRSNLTFNYHEVNSMEECYKMVDHAQIRIPESGDAESSIAIYCTDSVVRQW